MLTNDLAQGQGLGALAPAYWGTDNDSSESSFSIGGSGGSGFSFSVLPTSSFVSNSEGTTARTGGNSTRDGVFQLIGQGINTIGQVLASRNQTQQQQQQQQLIAANAGAGAGLNVNAGAGGVGIGGGIQLNTTTLLLGGLVLMAFIGGRGRR